MEITTYNSIRIMDSGNTVRRVARNIESEDSIMKTWLSIFIILLCIGSIVAGNIHWNHKLATKAELVQPENESVVAKEQAEQAEQEPAENETSKEKEESGQAATDVAAYTKNLPKELQDKFSQAESTGNPLKLVIYGSDSTPTEKGTWPDLLSQQLQAAYGDKIVSTTVITAGNNTSLAVAQAKDYEKVTELKPDIVLFEPFTLKDNTGKIAMKDRIISIEKMIASWKASNNDVTILLQPANPVHNGVFYPKQVDELKAYAEEQKLTYINHWESWPKTEDKKMLDYLTSESLPNENGHKLWADYLIDYFIAK